VFGKEGVCLNKLKRKGKEEEDKRDGSPLGALSGSEQAETNNTLLFLLLLLLILLLLALLMLSIL
jgi:hypothetical protein